RMATRVIRSMSHRLTSAPYHSLMGLDVFHGSEMPAEGDIIHLHGLTGLMGLRGLNALIPDGSPVFWTTHDLWPLSGGCILYSGCDGYRHSCGKCPILKTGAKSWARAELKMKEHFIKQKKVHPVANSSWMADHIQSSRVFNTASEVAVVPPMVDSAYFKDDIENIRKKLRIEPGKRVLSLGARAVTDRYKGIPEFLNAFASRPELAEQFVVLLFGEGEMELPRGIDIRTLGRIDSAEEMARVYYSSDIFVSPSLMETFGMALAEAQACGTPVAAFDVGGVRDAVSKECADYLVSTGDMDALLNAVRRAAEKSPAGTESWRLDRAWAQSNFSAPVIAEKQIAIYEKGAPALIQSIK
ncbi:MAG: glycosyltransferase, partial [Akkermansiaceae bacterium]